MKQIKRQKRETLNLGFSTPKTALLKKKNKMENVKNPKRVEIIDNEIAIFAPSAHQAILDQVIYHSNDQALSHYESHDQSLRFPKTAKNAETIWKILSADFTADFDLSPEFLTLGNVQESQNENAATASCYVPPRVDLLLDEHPERCIVVSGFTDADQYFSSKVSHLDGVFSESDNSWRFSLATLPLLLVYFPAPDYQHSDILKREFEPIECGF